MNNTTTPGGVELPDDLANNLGELLGILGDWLATTSDAVHADLARFAHTEYDYPDVWTLLEDLGRHSLALHHLTNPPKPAAVIRNHVGVNTAYQQKEPA